MGEEFNLNILWECRDQKWAFFQELQKAAFLFYHVFHNFSAVFHASYFQLCAKLYFSTNIYMKKWQNAFLKPYFSFEQFQNRHISEDSQMEHPHQWAGSVTGQEQYFLPPLPCTSRRRAYVLLLPSSLKHFSIPLPVLFSIKQYDTLQIILEHSSLWVQSRYNDVLFCL